MSLTYKYIKDTDKLKELMLEVFDDAYWESNIDIDSLESNINNGEDFLLFELEGQACALVNMCESSMTEGSKEIYLFDVEDKKVGRGNGVGSAVVGLLRDKIYKDVPLCGYAVSESAKFWSKHASSYDEYMMCMYKENHEEQGYEEDELYDCEGLMWFNL